MSEKTEADARWVRDMAEKSKPTMAAVVAAIRDRRNLAARGMIATHPPTLEEVAEIALTAALLVAGEQRIANDPDSRLAALYGAMSHDAREDYDLWCGRRWANALSVTPAMKREMIEELERRAQ